MADFDIRVIVDPSGAQRGTRQVRRELTGLEQAGTNAGRRIAAALAAAFTALVAGGALRSFSQIEQGLIGVAKTADLTAVEMERLRDSVTATSRELPFARTELLSIAQAAGQLGVSGVENLAKFSETIAKLGVASDLSGDFAATTLTRILTVTREGVGDIDQFASVIVALGNNFAATESEIANVASEIARAGAVFGISAAEAAALGAAFRSVGVEAEVSGTTFGKSMQTIEAALRQGGEEMQVLQQITGQTRDQLRQAFEEDAAAVFQQFIEGLGRIDEAGGSVNATLEALGLADQRILKALPTLAKNADLVARAFGTANAELGGTAALEEEVARNADSVQTQYQLLVNAILEVAESVGESLAPAFIDAATAVREFIVGAQEGEVLPAIYDAIGASASGLVDIFGILANNSEILAGAIGLIVARQVGFLAQSQLVAGALAAMRREVVNTQIAYELLGARTTTAIVAQRGFAVVAGTTRAAVAGLTAAFGGPLGLAAAVAIAGGAIASYVSRTSGLEGATRAMQTALADLTGEFEDQETTIDSLIAKYQELGRAKLATAVAEQELEIDKLQRSMEELRGEVDQNIISQITYLESIGRTPAEAGAASREAVDAFMAMRESGEDVTDQVLDLIDRLKAMGEIDIASRLLAGFNLVSEGADRLIERQEHLNRLLALQEGFDQDLRAGPPRRGGPAAEAATRDADDKTTPPTTPTGGGGGISFSDIIRDLERENELLALNVRQREIRADVLAAEDALERQLTVTERARIEALGEERQAIEDLNVIQDLVRDFEREAEALQLTERERDVRLEQLRLEEQLARSLTDAEAELVANLARESQLLRDIARARDDFVGGFEDISAQRVALVALFDEGAISADQLRDSLADLAVEAMELRIALGDGSFADGFVSGLFRMTEEAQNFQASTGQIFADFANNMATGFGDAIFRMISGTQSFSNALKEVARNAIGQLIQAIIQLGIQWVVQQALAIALGSAATSAISGMASAAAAAWATPAALASLASYGANAGPALAAIAGTIAATQALAQASGAISGIGGFREGGEAREATVARVSAGEFIVGPEATRQNLPILKRMNRGEPLSSIIADPGVDIEEQRRAAIVGGVVRGPGTGTSDSVVTTLPEGAFVIRERVARQNLPVLERLNRGDAPAQIAADLFPDEIAGRGAPDQMPRFARGGLVVSGPAGPGERRTIDLLIPPGDGRISDVLARAPIPVPPQPRATPDEARGDTFKVNYAPVFESAEAVDRYRESESQILAGFSRAVEEVAQRRRSATARRR